MATDARTLTRPPTGRQHELEIDRAIYLVDEVTRTYRYHQRNMDWPWLEAEQNERNKRHINGYTRIFPDGRTKVFRYHPSYR